MTRLVLVTAGTGSPSASRLLGERLAEQTVTALAAGAGAGTPLAEAPQVTHLELRTLAVDLAHHLATRIPSRALREAFDAIRVADGVIAVTPVFNGSYSGLFKLFFDSLDEDAMSGRPVLLAATGGTARHSLMIDHAMLPMFFYLKAKVAPSGIFAATKDWGEDAKLNRRIERAAREFAHLVSHSNPPKQEEEFSVPDFEDLLRG